MVWQVTNIPTSASGIGIEGVVTEHGDFRVQTSEGWEIVEISAGTPNAIARNIATVVRMARDAGFEQGRAHVRKALGL